MGQIPEGRLIAYTRMADIEESRDFSFPDIRGWKVLNTNGHEVGKVEEVLSIRTRWSPAGSCSTTRSS
jgi:hypothetical protein